jgi:hypothetical protein
MKRSNMTCLALDSSTVSHGEWQGCLADVNRSLELTLLSLPPWKYVPI